MVSWVHVERRLLLLKMKLQLVIHRAVATKRSRSCFTNNLLMSYLFGKLKFVNTFSTKYNGDCLGCPTALIIVCAQLNRNGNKLHLVVTINQNAGTKNVKIRQKNNQKVVI